MPEKTISLRYKNSPIELKTGTTIKPEDLYGRQKKTVEIDGKILEKVVITPNGEIFNPRMLTVERLDKEGSLTESPITCLQEDRSPLPILPSSYKTTRLLEDASPLDLINLKVRGVIPVECSLPMGLYKTLYSYWDSPILETAILNITPTHAFLLIGDPTDAPFLQKEETYSFFEEEESENPDEESNFSMF